MAAQSVQQVEVNVCYMMSRAIDLMLLDVERRMRAEGREFRHEKKVIFNRLMESIGVVFRYIAMLNSDIEESAKGNGYKDLDIWAAESNEMCRLLLLYADRCGRYPDDSNSVFKLLRSFEGDGIITEEVLSRFYLKK